MKYSLGPDKINSSLGQISSYPAFFSVRLFVFNAGIDLWLEEGSCAKQYKLHLLTNIQNGIELSFIFGGVSLNFPRLCYEEVVLWSPPFLNCGTHLFFFRECTSVSVFPKPAFIIEICSFEWSPGQITWAATCTAFTIDRGFFFLWEIRVTDSEPNIPVKSSIILCLPPITPTPNTLSTTLVINWYCSLNHNVQAVKGCFLLITISNTKKEKINVKHLSL